MKQQLLSILFIPCLALTEQALAQPTLSPQTPTQEAVALGGDEPVGPAEGETYAKYNITQSWELGYRFASVGGDDGKYRSDVNYGDGVRLLSSSLAIHSLEGHGNWFDEITLTTTGLGNDPYQAAHSGCRRTAYTGTTCSGDRTTISIRASRLPRGSIWKTRRTNGRITI